MRDLLELLDDAIGTRRAVIERDASEGVVESFVAVSRARGALVVAAELDPATAGVGLGPVASIVGDLLPDIPLTALDESGSWIRPALDDAAGRTELRRDLSEIYSAVAAVLRHAAARRPVVVVIYGIEWASDALLNLLSFIEGSVRAPVAIVGAPSGEARDLPPGSDLEIADDLATTDRAYSEPELIGAHLARAASDDVDGRDAVAERAATWLARAGSIATDRSDMVSAARLLTRAAALLPHGDPTRLECLADSCEALLATGRSEEIVDTTRSAIAEARQAGNRCAEARLRVWQLMVDDAASDAPPTDELEQLGETLAGCESFVGVAQVEEALAHIAWITDDADSAIAHMQKGLVAAYRSKARTPLSRMSVSYLSILAAGPTPVRDALRKFEGVGPLAQRSAHVEIALKTNAAFMLAMDGLVDIARLSLDDAMAIQRGLHQPAWVARVPRVHAWIELVDGRPEEALRVAGADLDQLLDVGHPAGVDAAVVAGRALCEMERYDEGLALSERALAALAANRTSEAPETSAGELHGIAARAAAHADSDTARSWIERSDAGAPPPTRFVQMADRLVDTALASAALGDVDGAHARLHRALALYEQKQATLPLERARAILERHTKNL